MSADIVQLISDHDRIETISGQRVRQFLADNQNFMVYDITGCENTKSVRFIRTLHERAIVVPSGFRLVRIHGVECHPPEEITQQQADAQGIQVFRGLP